MGESAFDAEVLAVRDRGTRLHSLVEQHLLTRSLPENIPADIAGFWQSLVWRLLGFPSNLSFSSFFFHFSNQCFRAFSSRS